MSKRQWRKKIVNFDDIIGSDKALFICLFEDCNIQFDAELPKRRNATEGVCCPRCHRDFFMYWLDENQVVVNFGNSYIEMYAVHTALVDKATKIKNGRKK